MNGHIESRSFEGTELEKSENRNGWREIVRAESDGP